MQYVHESEARSLDGKACAPIFNQSRRHSQGGVNNQILRRSKRRTAENPLFKKIPFDAIILVSPKPPQNPSTSICLIFHITTRHCFVLIGKGEVIVYFVIFSCSCTPPANNSAYKDVKWASSAPSSDNDEIHRRSSNVVATPFG